MSTPPTYGWPNSLPPPPPPPATSAQQLEPMHNDGDLTAADHLINPSPAMRQAMVAASRQARAGRIEIPRGPRTQGLRPRNGKSSFAYEWAPSQKRAWLEILSRELSVRALVENFDPYTSTCLWGHADLRLIGSNIQVTTAEIISFAPRAVPAWFAIGKRFEACGWTGTQLLKFIFWSRDLQPSAERALRRSNLTKQLKDAREHQCSAAGWTLANIDTTRVEQRLHDNVLSDCFLVSLGDGLVNFPEGEDAGILTIAVLHARINNHIDVRLSEIEQYIAICNLDQRYDLPAPNNVDVNVADKAAHERFFPRWTAAADKNDPNVNYIHKWWKAGGYKHD